MKKLVIKFFKFFFNNNDIKIKYLINNLLTDKILLLDIGAAGGINKRWEIISDNLSTSLVEPNIENAKILETKGYNVIKNCFYREGNKELINKSFEDIETCCSNNSCCGPQKPIRRSAPKIGRNDPCYCGSGRKHKKCCG